MRMFMYVLATISIFQSQFIEKSLKKTDILKTTWLLLLFIIIYSRQSCSLWTTVLRRAAFLRLNEILT